jgi:DNA-binding IclR family transcriptional regulator
MTEVLVPAARLVRWVDNFARRHGHTVQLDAALPGMGGVGVPIRDDAGQVIAALSVGASSDRIRRREAELAEMLKKEAMILMRAMAQPAKPNPVKAIMRVS